MPNRASIATGRLPRNHRCWCNGVDLPDDEKTIADVLNARGYHTALLGKPHFRITAMPYDGVPRGLECGPAWEQGLNDPARAADRAALEKRLLDEHIIRDDYRLWPTAEA